MGSKPLPWLIFDFYIKSKASFSFLLSLKSGKKISIKNKL